MTIALFLFVLFAAMTVGVPIAFALMLTALALMVHLDFFDAQLLAQNVQAGFDSFPLLAVPFFILAGELMNAGGLSRRIIDLARSLVGHIPGGLGYVAIAASLMLASMSGSAIADTAALATLLLPMMRKQHYPDGSSAGLIASGGIIAPIVPPSMPMVIYGVTTNTSISKLFLAGIVPGILMAVALVVVWRGIARKEQLPVAEKTGWPERRRVLAGSVWALMMPVIIIGGLRFGLFTPTEAAVVAAVYALIVSTLVYRELNLHGLYRVLIDASRTTGCGSGSSIGSSTATTTGGPPIGLWVITATSRLARRTRVPGGCAPTIRNRMPASIGSTPLLRLRSMSLAAAPGSFGGRWNRSPVFAQ